MGAGTCHIHPAGQHPRACRSAVVMLMATVMGTAFLLLAIAGLLECAVVQMGRAEA